MRSARLKLFPVKTEQALPWDINLGPDSAMWFTELAGHNIGRITAKGKIKEFPVPGDSGIAGITSGPDGNLWFTQNDISHVGSMSTTGQLGKTYSTLAVPVRHHRGSGREHLVLRRFRQLHRAAHTRLTSLTVTKMTSSRRGP